MAFIMVSLLDDEMFAFSLHCEIIVTVSLAAVYRWLTSLEAQSLSEISLSRVEQDDEAVWLKIHIQGRRDKSNDFDAIFRQCANNSTLFDHFVSSKRALPPTKRLWTWQGEPETGDLYKAYLPMDIATLKNEKDVFSEFDALTSSESRDVELTFAKMGQLAAKHNMTGGHWLLHIAEFSPHTGEVFPNALEDFQSSWSHVTASFFFGPLRRLKTPSVSFKKPASAFVISVYGGSCFGDAKVWCHRVFDVEKAIRQSGIVSTLKYKPDVYSVCGIYKDNRFRLRPTILQSTLVAENKSAIDNDYTADYKPDVVFSEGECQWWNVWQ